MMSDQSLPGQTDRAAADSPSSALRKRRIRVTGGVVALVWVALTGAGIDAPGQRLQTAEKQDLPAGLMRLAPQFLVVVGRGAPKAELRAAETIAAKLRGHGGAADNLQDDETALASLDRSAFHHLILVGTGSSNELLRQQRGHDWLDRTAFAKELLPTENLPSPPFYKGAPTDGFYVHGFGTFRDPATGLLESGRNDLYLVPHALDSTRKPDYRIHILVTGVDSAGVERAAEALLHDGLLGGVVPAKGERFPKASDAFRLSAARCSLTLPSWIPRAELLGWLQPDATEYAGFLQASGQPADQMWRAKYLIGPDIASFQDCPQRRSTSNELFVARLESKQAARSAAEGLIRTLSTANPKVKFQAAAASESALWTADSFHLAAAGPWLLMESLPEPRGGKTLTAAVQALSQALPKEGK